MLTFSLSKVIDVGDLLAFRPIYRSAAGPGLPGDLLLKVRFSTTQHKPVVKSTHTHTTQRCVGEGNRQRPLVYKSRFLSVDIWIAILTIVWFNAGFGLHRSGLICKMNVAEQKRT